MIRRIWLFFVKSLALAIAFLTPTDFEFLLRRTLTKKLQVLSATEGLALLFRIDTLLYSLQSLTAVHYGNFKHSKHRLTTYHDFFIERIEAEDKVLNFGTGKGSVAHDIAVRTGAHVDGIDISKENIELARRDKNHQLVRFFHGDGLRFAFDSDYDVVVLSNVLEHINDRPGLLKSLVASTNARRFLIRVPTYQRDWRVALKRELDIEWRLDLDHKTEYTPESFAFEVQTAGLSIRYLEVKWGEIWSELAV